MKSNNNNYFVTQQQYFETMIQKQVLLQRENSSAKQLKVQFYYNPIARQINLTRSLNEFFLRENIDLQNCQIFYFDEYQKYFIYIGTFPFEKDLYLKNQEFHEKYIRIKCKHFFFHQQPAENVIINVDQPKQIPSKKRAKERTIQEVLQKVAQWRGYYDSKKWNLQQGAKVMNMSKKTLDDYYMQIKLAENYGFDFESNKHLGIGYLRKYVKEKHQKKKTPLKILSKYMNIQEAKQKKQHVINDIDQFFITFQPSQQQQQQMQSQEQQ